MLTLVDIPQWLENLHQEAQQLAATLRDRFVEFSRPLTIAAGTDLSDVLHDHIAFVDSGVLRYVDQDRLIRFYTDGDFVSRIHPLARLDSEFACEMLVCSTRELEHTLAINPKFSIAWFRHRELEIEILHGLCGVHVAPQRQLKHELRTYLAGETIIEQGAPSKEIFVMISGEASVMHNGAEVGSILTNEIFGEIGYLIGSPRAATVNAKSDCMVQIVRGEDFKDLMGAKPTIALQLATTQARRIAGLNNRIISDQGDRESS